MSQRLASIAVAFAVPQRQSLLRARWVILVLQEV
jgi:hypothetical protein